MLSEREGKEREALARVENIPQEERDENGNQRVIRSYRSVEGENCTFEWSLTIWGGGRGAAGDASLY